MMQHRRRETYERIRKYRATKPLFAMDFQNDAEFVGGCIAGGRRYLHINANGDIDPCVFIHYSDSNIREKTLLEALQSPMMMAYHDGQPFNDNMYRPCPMLENPQKLREMVEKSGAHSTDLQSPESAEHLCAKCDRYAENWKPVAEEMWKEDQERKAANDKLLEAFIYRELKKAELMKEHGTGNRCRCSFFENGGIRP